MKETIATYMMFTAIGALLGGPIAFIVSYAAFNKPGFGIGLLVSGWMAFALISWLANRIHPFPEFEPTYSGNFDPDAGPSRRK